MVFGIVKISIILGTCSEIFLQNNNKIKKFGTSFGCIIYKCSFSKLCLRCKYKSL